MQFMRILKIIEMKLIKRGYVHALSLYKITLTILHVFSRVWHIFSLMKMAIILSIYCSSQQIIRYSQYILWEFSCNKKYTWKCVYCYFTALYSVTLRKNRKGGHFLPKTCYRHFRCRAQMMSLSLTPSAENNVCFL